MKRASAIVTNRSGGRTCSRGHYLPPRTRHFRLWLAVATRQTVLKDGQRSSWPVSCAPRWHGALLPSANLPFGHKFTSEVGNMPEATGSKNHDERGAIQNRAFTSPLAFPIAGIGLARLGNSSFKPHDRHSPETLLNYADMTPLYQRRKSTTNRGLQQPVLGILRRINSSKALLHWRVPSPTNQWSCVCCDFKSKRIHTFVRRFRCLKPDEENQCFG